MHVSEYKWRRLRLFACFWSILLFSQRSFSKEFQYRQFTTQEGLPSNTVYATLQDKNGDIWFATEYGVSRYNGFKFQNFNLEHGLSDNDVFKIFQDSRGRIWFFMSNGMVNYFENGKIRNPENTEILKKLNSKTYFNGFLEEPDGSIWLTTLRDGVFKINKDGSIRHLKPLSDLPSNYFVPGIWRDNNGQVRICAQLGIINLSKNPGIIEFPIKSNSEEIRFSKLLRDGRTIIGMENNILVCRLQEKQIEVVGEKEGYQDQIVSNITENSDGGLWISAINGLHYFENGRLTKENHQIFFQGKTVSGFSFDRQGNLWVSSLNEGVFLVSDKDAFRYGKVQGIPEIPITCLQFFQNKLFFGNDRGGIGFLENGRISMTQFPGKLFPYGRGRVREFRPDPVHKGYIWAVSENGLLLTDGQKFKAYYPSATKTMEFDDKYIYLGNANTCAVIEHDLYEKSGEFVLNQVRIGNKDENFIWKELRKGWQTIRYLIPETRVYRLLKDESGTIWMATHSGLFSLQFGKVIFHKEEHPDFGYSFQTMCIMGNGTIALGSNGRGILLLRPSGKRQWLNTGNGLISNYIRNLKPQGRDSLWVCTPSGLSLVATRFGELCYNFREWTISNSSLLSNDILDLAVRNDSLWIAVQSSIQCIPSFRQKIKFLIPQAQPEQIFINGKEFNPGKDIVCTDPGLKKIRVLLRNPDYRNQGEIRFQYRLLPDTSWRSVQGNEIQEQVMYTAGIHSLEVRRILNQQPEPGFALLQISFEQNFSNIGDLNKIDWQFRLLVFGFMLLLMLAIFLQLTIPQRRSESEDIQSGLWTELETLRKFLLQNTGRKDFSSLMDHFMDLKEKIINGDESGPEEAIALCISLLDFLMKLNPGFNASIAALPSEFRAAKNPFKRHSLVRFLLQSFRMPIPAGNFKITAEVEGQQIRLLIFDINQSKTWSEITLP